jgi:hypothetical protein
VVGYWQQLFDVFVPWVALNLDGCMMMDWVWDAERSENLNLYLYPRKIEVCYVTVNCFSPLAHDRLIGFFYMDVS